MSNDVMTTKELAAYTKLSVRFIALLVKRGDGPKRMTIGTSVRFRKEDVDAWLAASVEQERKLRA